MYNPQNVHECDKEKRRTPAREKQVTRRSIDTLMTLVGLIASLSSVPQVIKILQTQTIVGISLTTQLLALGAVSAWFLYGLYIKNKPLIITSIFTIVILSTVVIQIFIYK